MIRSFAYIGYLFMYLSTYTYVRYVWLEKYFFKYNSGWVDILNVSVYVCVYVGWRFWIKERVVWIWGEKKKKDECTFFYWEKIKSSEKGQVSIENVIFDSIKCEMKSSYPARDVPIIMKNCSMLCTLL